MAKKTEMKKVTLKDLIAKKEQIKNKKNETKQLFVSSLDGTITVQKPSRELCLEALDMDSQRGDTYLVYHCVIEPNLKDKELQDSFGCVEPIEIVEHIFEAGEVSSIAKELVKFAGYVDSVKEVKN